ncbi:putative reverse transcriptase domain-containing protein [Tanacetum coccineum]
MLNFRRKSSRYEVEIVVLLKELDLEGRSAFCERRSHLSSLFSPCRQLSPNKHGDQNFDPSIQVLDRVEASENASSLIPLSRGSFDVIVGIDWLSKRKFVIVCYEKVVRIPLEGDEKFRVHGERTLGAAKALMNAKVDEPRISDIPVENVLAERLHGLDRQMERKGDGSLYFMDRIWVPLVGGVRTVIMDEAHKSRYSVHPGADKMYYDLRDMYWWPGMKRDIATYVPLVGSEMDEAHASRLRWTIYPVLLADAAESVRDAIGFEYCLASSSGWTKVDSIIRCAPFEALYGRRCVALEGRSALLKEGLLEELSGVHDTFHVSNLKKCLADANLHVPEIKIDKTLRFVEEPVKIINREIKSLKRSGIPLVKVRWNSKRGPEFTWEREDYMKSKYPHLFVDRVVKPTS